MPRTQPTATLFLTAGVGDNVLTIPLLIELERRTRLSVITVRKSEQEFYQRLLPQSSVKVAPEGVSIFKMLWSERNSSYWIYPIGSCVRRFRLLHLLSPQSTAIGFTSLSGEKTWQAEVGFRFTLMPDLARNAWKNNMRLLPLVFPEELNRTYSWEDYVEVVRARMEGVTLPAEDTAFEPGIVIHAGSNRYPGGLEKYKRWPLENYFQVVTRLLQKNPGLPVYWIVGPGEDDTFPEIEKFARSHPGNRVIDTHRSFDHSLIRLFRFLTKMRYFVGNDSGICHLATFTGLPITSFVSGISQVQCTGQNGAATQVLWEDVECRGCTVGIPPSLINQFHCPNEWVCMKDLTVEKSWSAIEKHMKERVV